MNQWVIVLAVCAGIAVLTRIKKALTWPAVLAADAMLLFITGCSGLREALALVGLYLIVFAADLLFGKRSELMTKEICEKAKGRRLSQVLENGLAGCLCILLFGVTGMTAFLFGYYTSVFEMMADSMASDVGVLSRKPPRDICTLRPVARGISGGVSLLGLGVSGVSCVCAAFVAGSFLSLDLRYILALAAIPWAGMLTDSVIGSRLQLHYRCQVCGLETEKRMHCGEKTAVVRGLRQMTNGRVNLLCTMEAAILGILFGLL